MHRLRVPYLPNSLLKNAPHKDIIKVDVPSEKRGKKRWPATVAWRINIGTLSPAHHKIITSYSLSHAESFVIVKRRVRFERAKGDLKVFSNKKAEEWESQGIRFGHQESRQQHKEDLPPSQERLTKILDHYMSALDDVLDIISTTQEPLPRSKENSLKSWLAMRALEAPNRRNLTTTTSSSNLGAESTHFWGVHPALQVAFEAAYPAQHPDHRNLITIDFYQFLDHGIGENTFVELSTKIDSKIAELVRKDTFSTRWDTSMSDFEPLSRPPEPSVTDRKEQDDHLNNVILQNPAFRSVFRAARGFEVLKWMFEQRQDILARFVQQLGVPMADLQTRLTRIRAKRE